MSAPSPAALSHQRSWIDDLAAAPPERPSGGPWLWLVLAGYVLALTLVVPAGIGSSWRECDTQAIARNFLVDGFDPLRPRVDWRGDGDGAVECEFPLYQAMIASVLAATGEAEWPGRAISLLAMTVAIALLHRLLLARTGRAGAGFGALVFATGGHAFLLGSRVMPDALSTALALAGTVAFVQFLATGRARTLWLAATATALGCLVKPTALQVGLWQFSWALVLAPQRLRDRRVWLAWAAVLLLVGAWLWHGTRLHAETGLTFGVTAAGETKFPSWHRLADADMWQGLGWATLRFGFGPLGLLGGLWLLLRGRLDRADLTLALVAMLGLVGTLRYSAYGGIGPHYHVFAAVAGSWLAARALAACQQPWLWALAVAATLAAGAAQLAKERDFRRRCLAGAQIEAGRSAAALSAPTDLAVVHSPRERIDALWQRRTNFEEPIVLYHARRRGWVLPRDGFELEALAALWRRGARVVVDQVPAATPSDAAAWLEATAEQVAETPGGRVYRLRPD